VKQGVWDCDNYKSPGPNGINFGFIKDFWGILKMILCVSFLNVIGMGSYQKGINSTFIALIPKVASP